MSCHFAANANSQDTVLGLFKTLTYIATQEVTSRAYFICEARVVTIQTAKYAIINDSNPFIEYLWSSIPEYPSMVDGVSAYGALGAGAFHSLLCRVEGQ